MVTMLPTLIVAVSSAIGLTEILVRGRILQKWRDGRKGILRDLVTCSQCCGFWCGLAMGLIFILGGCYGSLWDEITPLTASNSIVFIICTALTTSALAFAFDTFVMKKAME